MAEYMHKSQAAVLHEIEMWKESVVESVIAAAMHLVLMCFPINSGLCLNQWILVSFLPRLYCSLEIHEINF